MILKPRRVAPGELDPIDITDEAFGKSDGGPKRMSKAEAYSWLFGSFNPHIIAELFWEQSPPWAELANAHVDLICDICESFCFTKLLEKKGAKDVTSRVWLVPRYQVFLIVLLLIAEERSSIVKNRLQQRKAAAHEEFRRLLEDLNGFPIN
ncbi:interferon-induced GTP-binding protein Mx2 [Pyricularia oryzae]|nr:interferon-induced GTP-binding protein Mx2 [Pyricularia oryzae]